MAYSDGALGKSLGKLSRELSELYSDITNGVLGGVGSGKETFTTVAASGAAQTVDFSTASMWDITLTADCTITLQGADATKACSLTLKLRQDGTGARKVTWPGSVTWLNGAAPSLHTAASSIDVVSLISDDGGTTWQGAQASPASKLDYVEQASDLTVTATSAGTAQAFLDGNSVTYDGATEVKIEMWSPNVQPTNSTSGTVVIFELFDGSTDLGRFGQVGAVNNNDTFPYKAERYLTPPAGAHAYHIKCWKSGANTPTVSGSAGGVFLPAFMRITRA